MPDPIDYQPRPTERIATPVLVATLRLALYASIASLLFAVGKHIGMFLLSGLCLWIAVPSLLWGLVQFFRSPDRSERMLAFAATAATAAALFVASSTSDGWS